MGDVVNFRPRVSEASIEFMYAPEIDPFHPYAFRIVTENSDGGVWLSKAEYLSFICDLVDALGDWE